MRLESIRVERFKNFTAQQKMTVECDVTCLIGKNESGKTTILKALHRLNPANGSDPFELTVDYPARKLARDRRQEKLDDFAPIEAVFVLEEGDADALAAELDVSIPESTRVTARRTYGGELIVEVRCDFTDAVRTAADEVGVDEEDDVNHLLEHTTIDETCAAAAALGKQQKGTSTSRSKALTKFSAELKRYRPLVDGQLGNVPARLLEERLPKFFYFSTYELLPGTCNLTELVQRADSGQLQQGDDTMLALLRLASGVAPKDFLDENYVSRKAELQSASLELSSEVFRYWKQNPALSVRFDTDMKLMGQDPQGADIRHRMLMIELLDERHGVETNFATRSAGFQWFFSFLAAFSAYRENPERVVVLLDEPGTSLHGEAQRDFLRYIFEELGTQQQVLYTTHSQHMIDPTRYETMRAVNDRATRDDPDLGVEITPVSLSADRHTILPVEAALGYSVAQHLFLGVGPHLAVEGSSDYVFLTRLSQHLTKQGREGLDPRLSIIPVGGIGNMPAFVAMMGRRLQVRALIDGAETAKVSSKVYSAAKANSIEPDRIVVLGEIDGLPSTADIEDLFTVKDYLWLYSRAVESLSASDLPDTPEPILRRIGIARQRRGLKPEFDHVGPAHQLTQDADAFFGQADDKTLDRFAEVFRLLRR